MDLVMGVGHILVGTVMGHCNLFVKLLLRQIQAIFQHLSGHANHSVSLVCTSLYGVTGVDPYQRTMCSWCIPHTSSHQMPCTSGISFSSTTLSNGLLISWLLRFTWTLFFSSHTDSTLTHISHTYDSSLPHLLHSDSYLSRSWLIAPTLTPPWFIYLYCTFTIYMARYPPVTSAWSYSNIPEF